jgi:hypothetical protein
MVDAVSAPGSLLDGKLVIDATNKVRGDGMWLSATSGLYGLRTRLPRVPAYEGRASRITRNSVADKSRISRNSVKDQLTPLATRDRLGDAGIDRGALVASCPATADDAPR